MERRSVSCRRNRWLRVGSLQAAEAGVEKIPTKGPSRVDPLIVPKMITNMAAGNVSIAVGARGKCTNVATACATGTHLVLVMHFVQSSMVMRM